MGMGVLILIFVSIIILVAYANSKKAAAGSDTRLQVRVSTSFGYGDDVDTSVRPDSVWIPKNKPVSIHDVRIGDGMLYVGTGLPSAEGQRFLEPSLIDPKLPIKQSGEPNGKFHIGYWPEYKELSPEAKYAYLQWLADGRKNPRTNIGFVFIFFYGLERRLLSDSQTSKAALAEAADIINEAQRLLNIYSRHGSFKRYATKFVDFGRVKFTPNKISINVPKEKNYDEFPLSLQVGLSYYCAKTKPIPAEWALYWYQNYPFHKGLRTAAGRCEKEFLTLYEKKYRDKFGAGLMLKEPKKRLKLSYRPATRSISSEQTLTLESLPDALKLIRPLKQIEEVVESAIDELDPYSRYLGRNPGDTSSLPALSLLPKGIDLRGYGDGISGLEETIRKVLGQKSGAVFRASDILDHWSFKSDGKISKNENLSVINLLDRLGYSVEPDIRFTNMKIVPSGKLVVFKKTGDVPDSPTKEYQMAHLILSLAMAVSSSDGEISGEEKRHLANHLQTCLKLSTGERTRLSALFTYLTIEPPKLSSLRKHLEGVNNEQRRAILEFLISIANADNRVDPEEIKILKKIYQFFGFDPESIYHDIHSGQTKYAKEPVVVKTSQYDSSHEYGIPAEKQPKEEALSLDEIRLRSIVQDTNRVFGVLKDIFEEDQAPSNSNQEQEKIDPDLPAIASLDSEHSTIVRKLVERDIFPRNEFEDLCDKFQLLPDGVIETINESFIEAYDDMLIEAEEDLVINQAMSKEILNARTN